MMLAELRTLLAALPVDSTRADYAYAVIQSNCLGKSTAATRRLTNQRLGELYALDPSVPLFRVLRHLWHIDEQGRPLIALLAILARDPLFLATVESVISIPEGVEFQRSHMRHALRAIVGERLNDATLEKVLRNAASSWSQSGHLTGRTFKIRKLVQPTAAALAYALYLANAAGFHGEGLLANGWVQTLDCSVIRARELAMEAKRMGLIDLRIGGDVVEINLTRLDPKPSDRPGRPR